jgi:mannonate dehydratase
MYIQEAIRLTQIDDEVLDFYRTVGVDMIHLDIRSGKGVSHVDSAVGEDLRNGRDCTHVFEQAREHVEAHGMTLNVVFMSAWLEISLGAPDMDDKTDAWCRMLESLGRAGIPHLGWNFKPMGNFRTTATVGRGRARYSTFDYDEFNRNRPEAYQPEIDEATMWERMERFVTAVIPVAEKAGVRMALHPDDPPLPEALAGVAQICSTPDQFRRIFDMAPSPNHTMLFCQGCMTEALGEGVYDFIDEMAGKQKIAWVHFRNVRGQLPHFEEVFIDEGDINMRRTMEIYRDNGFEGPFMMDHTPKLPFDRADWIGKAYAIGYIRALIQTVYGS